MGLHNVSRSRARLAACMLLAASGSSAAAETKVDPGDAIRSAWKSWRAANENSDASAGTNALKKLAQAKEDLGIEDLDAFGIALIRAAEARLEQKDQGGALALSTSAVQLDPDSPAVRWATAKINFLVSPLSFGSYLPEIAAGLQAGWRDPIYRRAVLGDLGTGALVALLATAMTVLATICLRRWRYFAHDFHHFFPRSFAPWQTTVLAALLLALPLAFRLGWVPFFLALLAVTSMYLSQAERLVAGTLVASLGLVPVLAGLLVRLTSFSGTPAEDVYRLERGGPESTASESRIRKRVEEGKANFPELFALGRLELRRGRPEDAIRHLGAAILERNNDAPALTNLGNAMFAKGDLEGATDSYQRATQSDPTLMTAGSNLSKLYSWQAKIYGSGGSASREAPGSLYANRELASVPLGSDEMALAARSEEQELKVENELRLRLLGDFPPIAWIYPPLLAALFVALGFAHELIEACSGCDKCGRPICRKCDPELGSGSLFCNQCVNVFARQGTVAPADKVRKQIEVARYQLRLERTSYVLSLLCSGAGHLYVGVPIAGASYAFLFLFAFFGVLFHQGVLKVPYLANRSWWGVVPLVAMMISVHLISVRDFFRRLSA
jgi:tetratricopeptide (TPR) repeat protein